MSTDKKEQEVQKTSAMEVNQNIRRVLTIMKIDPNAILNSIF